MRAIKRKKKFLFLILIWIFEILSFLEATSIEDYINLKECDQVIDKQLYKICYSYKYKGALSGWVTLQGDLVSKTAIKKRPKFYAEKAIPMVYRSKSKDYRGFGEEWNRGHFIVADADFDYDIKALSKAYTMANIIPQSALVNQKTWIKVERYGRLLAEKFGYIHSISIAKYDDPKHQIRNGVVIPSRIYRIYFNTEKNFEKCFEYQNVLDVNVKQDRLEHHEIACQRLKNV